MRSTKTSALLAGVCTIALAATAAPLPTAAASSAEAGRQRTAIDILHAAPSQGRAALGGERSRAVTLDSGLLDTARTGDRVTLRLFEDTTVTAVVDERRTVGATTTWLGGLEGEEGSFNAVEVGGVHHLSVTSVEEGTYEVSSTRDGDYEVVEAGDPPRGGDDAVDVHARGVDVQGGKGNQRQGAEGPPSEAAPAAGDSAAMIDVAIVYPPALVTQMGAPAMEAQFALGIAQTNEALAASGIGTRVRLVGTRQVAAAQHASLQSNYTALDTPGDGIFDEAQALREETHADLVSLWVAGSAGGASCGLGSLGGTNPQYDPQRAAWTVVYAADCATSFRVFAHELGHNLSGDHDAGASNPPSGSKPYARGYVDVPAQTITVMAYYDACTQAGVSCTRIGQYSNPNVSVGGRPTGTAAANNAQAIAEQVAAVANYRQTQIYPGAASIGGQPRFRGTAQAFSADWSPAVTLSYQWFLDGVAVTGATSSTVRLGRKDIGHTLTVQVTGSAPYYASVPVAAGPVTVGKALFRTTRPKLRGVPRAGRVLSVSLKGWKPKISKKSVKVRYQWMRNGKKIKGAKKATYRLRAKDRGKKITVVVKAKAKGYETAKRASKKVKVRR